MAEWDFESALNDYFGGGATEDGQSTTGDGDTFFAPSGWDFDKALNDYFNGVNGSATASGYFAPRGYEFPDASGIGAPEDFGLRHRGFVPPPPPIPTPTPTITPPARSVTPEDFGLRHRGFVPPPPPPTPTPTLTPTLTPTPASTPTPTPTPTGTPMPTTQPANPLTPDDVIHWLLNFARPSGGGAQSLPRPEEIKDWLGKFLPTPEELEQSRYQPFIAPISYGARAVGNFVAPIGAANEWARRNMPGVAGGEDLPLYVPLGIPYDATQDLKANYPGIEPSVYPMLAQMHTTVRPQWLMPPPYGQEGTRASGFALPEPLNSITLAAELGKRPDPSNVLHELAHQMAYREFGGIAFTWDSAPSGWHPFINAVQSYQRNPPQQFAAINKKLYDELTNPKSYLNTNPMEAYATIAELSGGDLSRMPPEFRKFYTWLGRKERVREPP